MKKLLSKTLLALAIVSFSSIVMADCGSCCEPCKEVCPPTNPEKSCDPCDPCKPCKACEICPPCEPCDKCCTEVVKIGEPRNCAYNAPARIDPACGWDAWVTASFLYWQPKEKGLFLGYDFLAPVASLSVASHNEAQMIMMETDYHPAFKIGLGFSSDCDDWTLYLEYTRFYSTDKTSYNLGNNFLSGRFLTTRWLTSDIIGDMPGDAPKALCSKWKLSMNIVDLELGRPYYLGQKLIFKPFYGLRGGTIDQKYKLDAISSTYGASDHYLAFSDSKLDSWVIGPRAGVVTDWMFGCNFRFFGAVAGSLLYQNFDTKVFEKLPQQTGVAATDVEVTGGKDDDVSYLTPNAELSLGLGYGRYFCNNEWYFDLSIGYSFNYYWNQNMMKPLADYMDISASDAFADSTAGDLMLHGLTLTARVDF